jgi:hypothetical protein
MKKSKIILFIVLIVFFGVIIFLGAPNLNPLYGDGLAFWGFVLTLTVIVLLVRSGIATVSGSSIKVKKVRPAYIVIAAAPWVILIAVGIFSAPFFHSARYRDQMPQPETRQFTSDVQPLDVSQLPIVDSDLASNLADKKLGEKPALGSQVTLGDPTIQKVDGKLVWVVPLEDSGFFKWLANTQGTPGYIVVSATDPSDVTYVDKYNIKYQPNAYLLDNLARHTRFDGGMLTGLTDYSFELDDSGKPYWVVSTYSNLLGFSLPEATGAIVVDAQTGKATRYTIANMPKWVDRVQPEDYIMTQLENRGNYIHGVFNFSNKDKFQTSDGDLIVYNNGRCYLYTGITSVGSDESATGFVLVDMVTKKPYLYNMSGATEYAAQTSAEGKVQNLKYVASFPLITNVGGQPTYFMTLKDDAGLIKQYAFVSVSDYSIVGTGETIQNALDDFNQSLNASSTGSVINTDEDKQTIEGVVTRFAAESQSGSTVYEFMIDKEPGKIFTATYDVSNQLALTKEGDKIKVTYSPSSSGNIVNVITFANETLAQ